MTALALWLGLTAAGATLIALPDTGPRVVGFSDAHGPGAVDSIGIVLLLVAFAILLVQIHRGRRRVVARLASSPSGTARIAFVAGLGVGLLVAGVFTDFWWWWLIGALALQVFWLVLWAYATATAPVPAPSGPDAADA